MLTRALQLTVILLISFVLIACGDKFQSGDKVWLDLPDKSLLKHGYAVAQVIEYKGNMVHIQVLKVEADNNHELLGVLKRGQAYVPKEMLREYESGRVRFSEKQDAARQLHVLIKKGVSAGSKEFRKISRVAEKYDLDEIRKVLALYRIQDKYFNKKTGKKRFLVNIPRALEDLEELLEGYPEAYRRLTDRIKAYYREQLERKAAVIGIAGKGQAVVVKAGEGDLFDKGLAKFAFNMRKYLDGLIAGKIMPAAEAAKNIEAIDKAEKAWVRFVTMDGKQLSGARMKDIIRSQQDSARSRLALVARTGILAKIRFQDIRSEKAARDAWLQAREAARPVSAALDRQIITRADEEQLFMKAYRDREKARIAADDKAFKHAIRKGLSLEASLKALDAYLKVWPQGRHVIEAQRKKAVVIAAISKRNERRKQRQYLVITMLKQGKVQHGKAEYQGEMIPFRISFSGYEPATGKFTGTMTWPDRKGQINLIEGLYNRKDNSIEFRETGQKKAGDWHTGDRYVLKPGKSMKLTGKHYYRQYLFMEKSGTVEITVKP